MKKYLYKAYFNAYDKPTVHYWEEEKELNVGIIENRILNICKTAVIHSIVLFKQEVVSCHRYQNNKVITE